MNSNYGLFHQNRTNLLLHIVAVPIFVICLPAAIWSLLTGNIIAAVLFLAGPAVSLAIQGFGHKLEAVPPEPFTGPGNFLQRIIAEQFFGFWVFVFTGSWYRSLRNPASQQTGA